MRYVGRRGVLDLITLTEDSTYWNMTFTCRKLSAHSMLAGLLRFLKFFHPRLYGGSFLLASMSSTFFCVVLALSKLVRAMMQSELERIALPSAPTADSFGPHVPQ